MTHAGRGLSAYSKSLVERLAEQGFDITVLAESDRGEPSTAQEHYEVRRVWRYGYQAIRDISRAVAALRPSVIHLQHELFMVGPRLNAVWPALLLKRLRELGPLVTTIHGLIPSDEFTPAFARAYAGQTPAPLVRAAYRALMKSLLRASDATIVHAESIAREARRYDKRCAPIVIPQGIYTGHVMDRPSALAQLGLQDRKRAVFFGYLLPYKGIETLVSAAPLLHERGIEVLIAGGDTGDNRLTHAKRSALPQGVNSLGYVPEERIGAVFGVADALVFPYLVSLASSAPLSQAVGMNVPAAVSDVETLADTLQIPEATFERANPSALAATVARVIEDEDLRARIRDRFATLRREQSWESVATRTAAVYERVLRGRPSDSPTSPSSTPPAG
jgi:glycosyltransferase involved in cell wall biosynthesis